MSRTLRKTFHILCCDLSPDTGEGYLAHSLIELLQAGFSLSIYTDPIVRLLRSYSWLRDRVLPLYLLAVCLALRLARHRVILLNYVPLWNFLYAGLARFGVRLAPITGSVLAIPATATLKERAVRGYLQTVFVMFSKWLLPRHDFLWCATPSVFLTLQNAGFRNLGFAFPYLLKIKPVASSPKTFDLFIYSNAHSIKNQSAVRRFLASSCAKKFKICYIGPSEKTNHNVSSYNKLPEVEFNRFLSSSRLYLTFSFEDGGITGFKALAYGIPVLCPKDSGLAFAMQHEDPYCFLNPFDAEDICTRASLLLSFNDADQNEKMTRKFDQLKGNCESVAIKWISSL